MIPPPDFVGAAPVMFALRHKVGYNRGMAFKNPTIWADRRVLNLLFKRFIKKESEEGCWLWTGEKNARGYGYIFVDGFKYSAHRLSAMLFLNFDILSDMHILHRCDIPSCVNPRHLLVGTTQDNMTDKSNKIRAQKVRLLKTMWEVTNQQ